jgi:putative endonuclease
VRAVDGPPLAAAGRVSHDVRPALGLAGEDIACETLKGLGYSIVERRFRTRRGEIDIVARDGATVVFVEVKGWNRVSGGTPAEAVTSQKRRRLMHVALEYLARHRLADTPCRFDVVAIRWNAGAPPDVRVLAGAFTLDDR